MLFARVRKLNSAEARKNGQYVLYWAQVNRRVESNHALSFALDQANELDLPVLFYEGLTCSSRQANDRFHMFLLEGVPGTERRLRALGIGYVFHLQRHRSDSASDPDDALHRLAADAAALVTDDYPRLTSGDRSVADKLAIPFYAVDSSCIVPMSHFTKQEYAAYTIRPKIGKVLEACLRPVPTLRVKRRFTGAPRALHTRVTASNMAKLVSLCEIDHSIAPSTEIRGGRDEAECRLRYFLDHNLRRYAKFSREPSAHATSGLSPYLHFGHISSLEVALAVREYAAERKLIADEFLEELIVRRELAFNFTRFSAVA